MFTALAPDVKLRNSKGGKLIEPTTSSLILYKLNEDDGGDKDSGEDVDGDVEGVGLLSL